MSVAPADLQYVSNGQRSTAESQFPGILPGDGDERPGPTATTAGREDLTAPLREASTRAGGRARLAVGRWIRPAALLLLGSTAAVVNAENDRRARVIVPVVPAETGSSVPPSPRSSASYVLTESLPEGMWRWSITAPPVERVVPLATALTVDLRFVEGKSESSTSAGIPETGEELRNAARKLSAALQLTAPEESGEDVLSREPSRLLEWWESQLADRRQELREVFLAAAAMRPEGTRIGVTLTVTRERATASCAATEVFHANAWTAGPLRLRQLLRETTASATFGPTVLDSGRGDPAGAGVDGLIDLMLGWVRSRYLPEAATAIALEHGLEPCGFEQGNDSPPSKAADAP